MKNTIIIIFISAILLSACKSKAKEAAAEKDSYEKTKETLLEKEKKNPVSFLSVSSHDKHNLIGQTVIKGIVTNKAKVCTYKDVQLELSFYSKTGAFLEKDNETVYDAIAPGTNSNFKTKYFAPKGTDSVSIKVLGAKSE